VADRHPYGKRARPPAHRSVLARPRGSTRGPRLLRLLRLRVDGWMAGRRWTALAAGMDRVTPLDLVMDMGLSWRDVG